MVERGGDRTRLRPGRTDLRVEIARRELRFVQGIPRRDPSRRVTSRAHGSPTKAFSVPARRTRARERKSDAEGRKLQALGMRMLVTDTLMRTPRHAARLAKAVLDALPV